jgi:catechol 2,3-dioxygenase-like lactoylglutathione lyase family enzyme
MGFCGGVQGALCATAGPAWQASNAATIAPASLIRAGSRPLEFLQTMPHICETANRENAMPVQLNHTILYARDSKASAVFLSDVLGLPPPAHWGPFEVVTAANGTNLDFLDADGEIASQHYAFLVGEAEFDAIFGRIKARGLSYWADPGQTKQGEINRHDDGRGLYFEDPNGHLLEIITKTYGSGGWNP